MPGTPEDGDGTAQSASGIERALDVLLAFVKTDAPTLGVTEIATSLGMSKTVVHRILGAFCSREFVEADEASHRYRLGPQSLYLGFAYLDRVDIRAVAREELAALVAATEETATLSIRVGWNRVYLDQVTPDRDVKMMVQLGRPFPLHAGASSKAFLAFMPVADQEEYLRNHDLVRLTPLTITDPGALRRELAAIRVKGFAVSLGERDARAGSVAAPIFDRDKQPVAVVSVAGPVEQFRTEIEKASTLLVAATERLSARLGYREPQPAA